VDVFFETRCISDTVFIETQFTSLKHRSSLPTHYHRRPYELHFLSNFGGSNRCCLHIGEPDGIVYVIFARWHLSPQINRTVVWSAKVGLYPVDVRAAESQRSRIVLRFGGGLA